MFKDFYELAQSQPIEMVLLIVLGDFLGEVVKGLVNMLLSNRLDKVTDLPKEVLEYKAMLKDFKRCQVRLRRDLWLSKHLRLKKAKVYFTRAAKEEGVLYNKYITSFLTDIPPNR